LKLSIPTPREETVITNDAVTRSLSAPIYLFARLAARRSEPRRQSIPVFPGDEIVRETFQRSPRLKIGSYFGTVTKTTLRAF
jgi:hypothetical protein